MTQLNIQLPKERLKKFRLARIQNIASAIPVQFYSQLSWQTNWRLVIKLFIIMDYYLSTTALQGRIQEFLIAVGPHPPHLLPPVAVVRYNFDGCFI